MFLFNKFSFSHIVTFIAIFKYDVYSFPQQATKECTFGQRLVPVESCDLIDVRQGRAEVDEDDEVVCCDVESITEHPCPEDHGFRCVPDKECPDVVAPTQRFAGISPDEKFTCKQTSDVCCAANFKEEKEEVLCGVHNKTVIGKVSSSTDNKVNFAEWPNMCMVIEIKDNIRNFIGGASLIAPGIVLTGVQKVFYDNPDGVYVRCGELEITTTDEPEEHQERKVRKITFHPAFYLKIALNNFVVLHLEEDFRLDFHIRPMCLPRQSGKAVDIGYDPEDCYSMGWGKDGLDGSYSFILRQAFVPIVDRDSCQTKLRKSPRIRDDFVLHDSLVCAGGGHNDTCVGDGGGPLVCRDKNAELKNKEERFIQVGIVSWGLGCGTSYPGVYANVSEGICFIDWVTKCHNGDKYKDFINVSGCQDWMTNELIRLRKREESLESDSSRSAELAEVKMSIKNAEELSKSCLKNA